MADMIEDVIEILDRSNSVVDWPDDERELFRQPGWKSFEQRTHAILRLRAEKIAALATQDAVFHLLDKAVTYRESWVVAPDTGQHVSDALVGAAHDIGHPGCEDSTVEHLAVWVGDLVNQEWRQP